MAQKTDAALQTQNDTIQTETTANANTAARIGQMYEDIIDSKINNDKIVDEDDMVSNSATLVPSQQSVKAYVDAVGDPTWGSITGTLGDQTDLQTALGLKANLASPALSGSPTAPTQSAGDNSTKIATTAYADAKVADAINNGTTAIAPSQNAVFDSLALKTNILYTYRRLTADHTLDATDLASVNTGQRVVIEMNVGAENTLTVPANATQAFPLGSEIRVTQYGGGRTVIAAAGGVTLRASAGILNLPNQYAEAILQKLDTNEWYLRNGDPAVTSSSWTPTLTNTTNVAASTAYLCSYTRVGSRVTVSGRVDIDPTSTGNTVLGISLPVASNFATANQAGGVAFSPGIAGQGAAILSDATNDRLTLQYIAVDTTNQSFYFTAGYEII